MKLWNRIKTVASDVFDKGYELADYMRGKVKEMTVSKQQKALAQKATRWYKGFKQAGIDIKPPEGIEFTKGGGISAKRSDTIALQAFVNAMGGTVKQWAKANPEEYAKRQNVISKIAKYSLNEDAVNRARMLGIRYRARRAADEAFEDFKDWYESSDNKQMVSMAISGGDYQLETILKTWGSAVHYGTDSAEFNKTVLDTVKRAIGRGDDYDDY